MFELLLGVRRAVLGNPAAARGVHDLLVAEGRRYAETPAGAELRDALAASEAVENLRRVWETLSLNVLDGPARAERGPRRMGGVAGRRGHRKRPRQFSAGSVPPRRVRLMLTDPHPALAEQSNFIGYLVGLAGAARAVHALAADSDRRAERPRRSRRLRVPARASPAWETRSNDWPNPSAEPRYETAEGATARPTSTRWLR